MAVALSVADAVSGLPTGERCGSSQDRLPPFFSSLRWLRSRRYRRTDLFTVRSPKEGNSSSDMPTSSRGHDRALLEMGGPPLVTCRTPCIQYGVDQGVEAGALEWVPTAGSLAGVRCSPTLLRECQKGVFGRRGWNSQCPRR